jgi:arginine-tRNA-protein transferase
MNNSIHDIDFIEEDRECSYFEDKISDIRYKYIEICSTLQYKSMLERGWRRFGRLHFSPVCKTCDKCTSIRILADEYKFSKSDRRVLVKNQNTRVVIKKPSLTMEHIALYHKYHQKMAEKKDWPFNDIDPLEYKKSYVNGAFGFGYEFLFFRDNRLIGVSLVDVLSEAISAIYCFYDHDYEHLSIGKFSILTQIQIAKQLKIPYIYLGYWIKDHLSMGYKEKYTPFEILTNRAELDEEPMWRKYERKI